MTTMTEPDAQLEPHAETEPPDGEDEAADLEPDDDDREPDDDDDDDDQARADLEPEAEPEPAPPVGDMIGPDELRKAENAIKAQRKKLAGIMGEAMVAHDCPLCASLGFLPELPPPGTRLELVADENGEPAFALQAPANEPPYIPAKDKAACDWCDGWGFVLSGAKADHSRVTPCSRCAGNGWITVAADMPPGAPVDGAPAAAGATVPPGSTVMGPDAWGRPAGHQHWGVPPSSIGV